MKIDLLAHTPNPEHVVARAAAQCYNPGYTGDDFHIINRQKDVALIKKIMASGHHSVLEHATFTFGISGISRATSHQLVRFRVASFSQQSQRYCDMRKQGYVEPDSIDYSPFHDKYAKLMGDIQDLYVEMVDAGVPKEDARFVLPNASPTNLVMTMNARELIHACRLRCCERAQWEIRKMFIQIAKLVKPKAPIIFARLGAPCEFGVCPEGEMSCQIKK